MTSSEEDFCWISASDSSESDMSSEDENVYQNGSEPESKNFKKKLHSELFKNDVSLDDKSKKSKKRKAEDDHYVSPKKKKIKQEPESDVDSVSNRNSSLISDINESKLQDYLNKKVKEENSSFVKLTPQSKVNQESGDISGQSMLSDDVESSKKKKKCKKINEVNETSVVESNALDNTESCKTEDEGSKKSKKKKKRDRESVIHETGKYDNSNIDISRIDYENSDEFNDIKIENSIKEKKKKKKRNTSFSNEIEVDTQSQTLVSENNTLNDISAILHVEKMLSDSENDYNSTVTQDHSADQDYTNLPEESINYTKIEENSIKVNKSILKSGISNGKSSSNRTILEKIRFEDDKDEVETEDDASYDISNKALNKYIQKHPPIKIIKKKVPKDARVTDNDEVWVLNLPQDVNIDMLKNTKLIVDNKCKIKINNESYIGNLKKTDDKLNFLCSEKDQYIFKNIDVIGSIQLHKRIPKPHFMEDNIIVNSNSVIPLPETKVRHPLLGSDYKLEAKLPSFVKERLKDIDRQPASSKKKKDVKVKREIPPVVVDEVLENKPKKKKKKRKQSVKEEDSTECCKKRKYNPDSVDAWESEKAIEENLFNF